MHLQKARSQVEREGKQSTFWYSSSDFNVSCQTRSSAFAFKDMDLHMISLSLLKKQLKCFTMQLKHWGLFINSCTGMTTEMLMVKMVHMLVSVEASCLFAWEEIAGPIWGSIKSMIRNRFDTRRMHIHGHIRGNQLSCQGCTGLELDHNSMA